MYLIYVWYICVCICMYLYINPICEYYKLTFPTWENTWCLSKSGLFLLTWRSLKFLKRDPLKYHFSTEFLALFTNIYTKYSVEGMLLTLPDFILGLKLSLRWQNTVLGQKTHLRLTFDWYKVLGTQPFSYIISMPLWCLIRESSLPSSFNSVKFAHSISHKNWV